MRRRQGDYDLYVSGWQVEFHADGLSENDLDWARDFNTVLPRLIDPPEILKHDHRSNIGVIDFNGINYVVKKFTLQNSWFWFKFTSIFFPSLGEIACRNSLQLRKQGILTLQPVVLMQRIKMGMVVDSWLVYRFMEGQPLTTDDAVDIVSFVKRMHEVGWIHRDPHPGNFIRTDKGVAMLDPIRARRSRCRYFKGYDLVLMAHDMPSAPELYGRDQLGLWLAVASVGHNVVRFYRLVKYTLRRLLGMRAKKDN